MGSADEEGHVGGMFACLAGSGAVGLLEFVAFAPINCPKGDSVWVLTA
ncbi:MAG: hypothetical protein JOZ81_30755 [Chloroflexi bacterium]|nr:hypothetical protein [Chloroflexota bacterium]